MNDSSAPAIDSVTVSLDGGIGHVEINRPEKKNAIDSATADRLTRAIGALARDSDCRVLVLHGRGGDLSSGADLTERPAGNGAPPALSARALMLRALRDCPVPVVTAVDGWAVGLGAGMLGASHFAVAGASSRFVLPEGAAGFFPYAVAPYLTDRVTARTVLRWVLTGRRFGAAEALAGGLVDEVCPAGGALAAARELAAALAVAPRAVAGEATGWLRRHRESAGGPEFTGWCEERMAAVNASRRSAPDTPRQGPETATREGD